MLFTQSTFSQALNLTAGPYPKEPDFLKCDPTYGEVLDPQDCLKALETMPDGLQFTKYISHKQYPGQTTLETPVFYFDNESKEYLERMLSCKCPKNIIM